MLVRMPSLFTDVVPYITSVSIIVIFVCGLSVMKNTGNNEFHISCSDIDQSDSCLTSHSTATVSHLSLKLPSIKKYLDGGNSMDDYSNVRLHDNAVTIKNARQTTVQESDSCVPMT